MSAKRNTGGRRMATQTLDEPLCRPGERGSHRDLARDPGLVECGHEVPGIGEHYPQAEWDGRVPLPWSGVDQGPTTSMVANSPTWAGA